MKARTRSNHLTSTERAAAVVRRGLCVVGLLIACSTGCNDPADAPMADLDLQDERPFVAVPRAAEKAARNLRQKTLRERGFVDQAATGDDFYLAIHKHEFGTDKRWFLSAFLKQSYPAGVSGGAAVAQGTRVVSLIAQNNRIYIVSNDSLKKMSDLFDPTVVVETYPVVSYPPFEHLPGAANYVLVDPASAINKFSLISANTISTGQVTNQVHVEISMLQAFRETTRKDGITFEQIFSGYAEKPVDGSGPNDSLQPYVSGTLSIALRRYGESSGFMPAPIVQLNGQDIYLRSEQRLVPNQGFFTQNSLKWGVSSSQPIEFVISSSIDTIQADPAYKNYALYDALAKGVTQWNQAFGYTALTVRKATAEDDFAQDDKNFIIVDTDPAYGAAFSSLRANPNTGEIRGATVYLSYVWILIADVLFDDDPPLTIGSLKKPAAAQLIWEPMGRKGFDGCQLWAPPYRDAWAMPDVERPLDPRSRPSLAKFTKKQKVEQYLTHQVMHEIGHTLGLRHNFMGSLTFDDTRDLYTSSVMDYIDDLDAFHADKPQSFDITAIRRLYGLSADLPVEPFCNDDGAALNPDCATFDRTEDPYTKHTLSSYSAILKDFLDRKSFVAPNNTINLMLAYVRSGKTLQVRQKALEDLWNASGYSLKSGKADPTKLMTIPEYGARTDLVAARIIQRMYLDEPGLRGRFTADPSDGQIFQDVFAEASTQLKNVDKIRSVATRRMLARWMKKLQTPAAYAALATGRATLDTEIKSGIYTGDEAIRAEDALKYMSKLLDPYFVD